jgi:hypothetical protein
MNSTQLVLLALVTGTMIAILYAVFALVPAIVRDGFLLRLSRMRDELEQLDASHPGTKRHRDVASLDDFLAGFAVHGRMPTNIMVAIWSDLWMMRRRGEIPAQNPRYRGLSLGHQKDLRDIEDRVVRDSIRTTLLGSRAWFLMWPIWLIYASRLGPVPRNAPRPKVSVEAERVLVSAAAERTAGRPARTMLQTVGVHGSTH